MTRLRPLVVLTALVGSLFAVPGEAAPAVGALPVARPQVAPAPDGVKGRPFVGLLSVPAGFVQEEYLVSGTAAPAVGPAVAAGLTPLGTSV